MESAIRSHPPDAVTENVFEMRLSQKAKLGIESLPGDLEQAVEELEKDDYIKNVLGGHITEKYLEAKKSRMGRLSCAGNRMGNRKISL